LRQKSDIFVAPQFFWVPANRAGQELVIPAAGEGEASIAEIWPKAHDVGIALLIFNSGFCQ
jgi:hypothetical protein